MKITLESILEKYSNPEYIKELEEEKREYILNRENSKNHNDGNHKSIDGFLESILEKYSNPEYIKELEEEKREYILNRENSKKHNKDILIMVGEINKKPPIKGG